MPDIVKLFEYMQPSCVRYAVNQHYICRLLLSILSGFLITYGILFLPSKMGENTLLELS